MVLYYSFFECIRKGRNVRIDHCAQYLSSSGIVEEYLLRFQCRELGPCDTYIEGGRVGITVRLWTIGIHPKEGRSCWYVFSFWRAPRGDGRGAIAGNIVILHLISFPSC